METVYKFNQSNEKLVEKILDHDELLINHMILNKGDRMPKHDSNSNVYMVILRGTLSLALNENPVKKHHSGSIVNIPGKIHMDIFNNDEEQVEFLVLKAPSPRLYK